MLVASTMASPIAWHHHYGIFVPMFATALPALMYVRPLGRATAPLFLLSYVAIANCMPNPEGLFWSRWLGLAGSHVFFGGLIFFGLLLALRVTPNRCLPFAVMSSKGSDAEGLQARSVASPNLKLGAWRESDCG